MWCALDPGVIHLGTWCISHQIFVWEFFAVRWVQWGSGQCWWSSSSSCCLLFSGHVRPCCNVVSTSLRFAIETCEIQLTKHLFMEFTDDPGKGILPSHTIQYIIENAPKLQSLAIGYTTMGSLLPHSLRETFFHPTLDYLWLSPNDLGAALSPFEYGLSTLNISHITLLRLPPAPASSP